jgi:hypothetical protein
MNCVTWYEAGGTLVEFRELHVCLASAWRYKARGDARSVHEVAAIHERDNGARKPRGLAQLTSRIERRRSAPALVALHHKQLNLLSNSG